MKKATLILTLILVTSLSIDAYGGNRYANGGNRSNNKQITASELPQAAQTFIKTHFGDKGTIIYAEKHWYSYEVRLGNGFEIDFYNDGTWKDIETNHTEMPLSIIKILPKSIQDYISTNFKDWSLTEISKKKYGFELELVNPAANSDVELKFDHQGAFLKADY